MNMVRETVVSFESADEVMEFMTSGIEPNTKIVEENG